jgi:hypothetical protein
MDNTRGTSLDFGFQATTPNAVWLQNSQTTDLSVNYPLLINPNGGNVSVGNNNPDARLHISSGTIKLDGSGSPAAGGALCLNAAKQMSKCTSAIDASGNCTCP